MWCSLKEFQRTNRWAQENTLRNLQRLIAQGRLPFESRCNVSAKNKKRYEIYITEPSEIALLLKIRKNKMPSEIPETTREAPKDTSKKAPRKRVRVILPEELASLAKTPGYHLVILEQLTEYVRREKQETSYKNVRVDISDDTFQLIRSFAQSNRLTVTNATQIIFDKAFAEIQN